MAISTSRSCAGETRRSSASARASINRSRRSSFTALLLSITDLIHDARTLIGEEANAVYEETSGGIIPTFTLPHSGIQVRYPLVAYHNALLPGLFVGRGALRFTLDLISTLKAREAH